MVRLTSPFVLTLLSTTALSLPLHKRIDQTISDSTQKWQAACLAAGGADQCNPLSVTSFTTLLAAAGPCGQQDSADQMVDLAKTLNNDADMIKFAQIFVQQPRNSPNSVAIPYCQTAPKNAELNGLFQCQFQSADQTSFAGGLQVGAPGTIPLGLSAPLSPAGSCPAHPDGPIADGTQLVDQVSSPGTGSGNATASATGGDNASGSDAPAPTATDSADGSGDDSASATPTPTDSSDAAAPTATDSASGSGDDSGNDDSGDCQSSGDDTAPTDAPTATATDDSSPTATATDDTATATDDSTPAATATATSSSDFQLKNGQDAQALNAKFASLSADATCNEGDQACVNGGFAQCVSGKFVVTQCAGGTQCFALPLVNNPGTSLSCTTQEDTAARIAAAGAQGGVTGNDN
ncbi:hypothetical protein BDW22DRAFT_1344828 [Trametopsis cervina]|nr:hypothetical protein BDW22DRAFT_1344828 [Trametopsis cervina]